MGLVWSHGAVVKPLLDCSVLLPSVISAESLDWQGQVGIEYLIFLGEDGQGFLGGLVLVNLVVIVMEEGGLLHDGLVLLNYICMSSWQSLLQTINRDTIKLSICRQFIIKF